MAHDELEPRGDGLLPEPDLGDSARAKLSCHPGLFFSSRLLLRGVLISLGVHTFCLPLLLSATILFAPPIVRFADQLSKYTAPHDDASWQLQLDDVACHAERTVASGNATGIVEFASAPSPVPIIKADVLRPEEAEYWDWIGTYRLNDEGGNPLVVQLYVYDTGTRTAKQIRRGDGLIMVSMDGNRLSFHAIYQDQSGQWKHRKLWGPWKSGGFRRVQKISPDAIVLELEPAFPEQLLFNAQGEALDSIEEQQRKIAANMARRVTLTLSLDQGVPVIKELGRKW